MARQKAKSKSLTRHRRDKIRRLFNEGMNCNQIAKELRCHRQTVSSWLLKLKLTVPKDTVAPNLSIKHQPVKPVIKLVSDVDVADIDQDHPLYLEPAIVVAAMKAIKAFLGSGMVDSRFTFEHLVAVIKHR